MTVSECKNLEVYYSYYNNHMFLFFYGVVTHRNTFDIIIYELMFLIKFNIYALWKSNTKNMLILNMYSQI